MSKRNLYSSNNSGTSSETSETLSVEENNQITDKTAAQSIDVNNKDLKSWKRMKDSSEKDADPKRPPWRAVSLSTLPKPDKNALLRAKLLDASRRLRAGKTSIGLQTNLEPTKLLKDVSVGAQTDLLLHKEIGILTDGSYTKKTDGSDKYILSYSVTQMTDEVKTSNIATQTLLPRVTHDYFLDAYFSCDLNTKYMSKFNDIEKKLLQQICEIRCPKSELAPKVDIVPQAAECIPVSRFTKSNVNDKRSSLLQPTLASWNFEYGDIENDLSAQITPYVIYANNPSFSFTPLPSSRCRGTVTRNRHYPWKSLFLSIDELVQESNRLVDTIEDILLFEKDTDGIYWNAVDDKFNFNPQKMIIPSEHWAPLIEEQEKELSELEKNIKPYLRSPVVGTSL